jgi:hypothetical protein
LNLFYIDTKLHEFHPKGVLFYSALEIAELINAASFDEFAIIIKESINASSLIDQFEGELVGVAEGRDYFCNLEPKEVAALEIGGQLSNSDRLIHIY